MPRQRKIIRLTDEQRKLVEDNHNLIYSFAISRKISIEEYYDLLAIGLCKAAYYYNPEKGKFSTIAYIRMQHELIALRAYKNKLSNVPTEKLVYYDHNKYDNNDGDSWEFSEINTLIEQSDSKKPLNRIIYKDNIKNISSILTLKENETLYYTLKGYTHQEISDIKNVTRQAITNRLRIISKKIRKSGIL